MRSLAPGGCCGLIVAPWTPGVARSRPAQIGDRQIIERMSAEVDSPFLASKPVRTAASAIAPTGGWSFWRPMRR